MTPYQIAVGVAVGMTMLAALLLAELIAMGGPAGFR